MCIKTWPIFHRISYIRDFASPKQNYDSDPRIVVFVLFIFDVAVMFVLLFNFLRNLWSGYPLPVQ